MTTKTTITCDGCGKELPATSNGKAYRLVLTTQEYGSDSGFVQGLSRPPIKNDKHFCGLHCVGEWAEKGYP